MNNKIHFLYNLPQKLRKSLYLSFKENQFYISKILVVYFFMADYTYIYIYTTIKMTYIILNRYAKHRAKFYMFEQMMFISHWISNLHNDLKKQFKNYRKGSHRVTLDNGHQLLFTLFRFVFVFFYFDFHRFGGRLLLFFVFPFNMNTN